MIFELLLLVCMILVRVVISAAIFADNSVMVDDSCFEFDDHRPNYP